MSYKNKLILYFSALFLLFAAIFFVFQWQYDKTLKKKMLENRLDVYSDLVAELPFKPYCENDSNTNNYSDLISGISKHDLNDFSEILPEDLRVSVIDSLGHVIYESTPDIVHLTNHRDRPEIAQAFAQGVGSHIRMSNTIHRKFYYYAKKYPNFVVRVALPYNETTKSLLSPDSIIVFFVLMLLFLALISIFYISNRFGQSVENLKRFVDSAERGLVDYDYIKFPKTELGNLGSKIIAVYRKAEERRVQLEVEKEKKTIFKKQMSNNITHELRTPVTAIQGYLETIERAPEIDPEKRNYFVHRALIQSQRLSDLIRDLALVTKMEEAAEKIQREKVLLSNIVEEVKADLSAKALDNNVSFSSNIPDNLYVEGNSSLLYSIFCNLYENSIKYASPCKCQLELLEIKNHQARFSFSDTGNGLDEKHLSHIFERFYRSDDGRTRKEGGTGLGLSIVKNAIQLHGGTIVAVSKKNDLGKSGLTFILTLPVLS